MSDDYDHEYDWEDIFYYDEEVIPETKSDIQELMVSYNKLNTDIEKLLIALRKQNQTFKE